MKKTALFILTLFVSAKGFAQSLEVSSHYPASAYVVRRILPFVVTGQEGLSVLRVDVQPMEHCSSLVDPFYPETFHLYCRQPGVVDLQIFVKESSGSETNLQLDDVSIALERAPSDEFDAAMAAAKEGP